MPDSQLIIMFVDICDSTQLFAEYGDAQALAMTSACIDELKAVINHHTGSVVQTFGDGILCTFTGADHAFKAAHAFQNALANQKLSIHVGCHYGPVIKQQDSIYGDAVNIASRLADLADNDETIWSQDAAEQLAKPLQIQLRSLGSVTVKGKPEPFNAYLMIANTPHEATITNMRTTPAIPAPQRVMLELKYNQQAKIIGELSADFTLGRQSDCDLVVEHSYVSRRHATIECKRGRFLLLDHSTNGCYVVDEQDRLVVLKRDFLQLSGTGSISLGVESTGNQDHLVHYRVVLPAA